MIITSKKGAISDLKKDECHWTKPASAVMLRRCDGLVINDACCRPICFRNNKRNIRGSNMWLEANTCYEQTLASKDW